MSKTYKDRYYCAYYYEQNKDAWYELNSWGVGCSSCRKYLKRQTNRGLRRYKGEVGQGGWYKKPFCTVWDVY